MTRPHFRAGVIPVVRRSDGAVLAFERGDVPGSWQLPQGGIDVGERPVDAAWRELAEETDLGPNDVRLAGEHSHWTVYEFPSGPERPRPEQLGQAHRWFFFDAVRDDIEPHPDGRELVAWRWMAPAALVAQVVAFRRPSYRQVLG